MAAWPGPRVVTAASSGGAATAPLALRLAIGRDGIGLELAEPAELGCLRVVELSTTLPGMRFPVDVSGGVTRFRHRRGELQILRVEVAARDVERWMAPRLRGLVGTRHARRVDRGRTSKVDGLRGLRSSRSRRAPRRRTPRDAPILAFDVHALAEGEDIVLVVDERSRGRASRAATAMALACVDAVLGAGRGARRRRLHAAAAGGGLARALLPGAGARVPSTEGVRWAALGADGGTWVLHASRGADAAAPTEDALRARESRDAARSLATTR